MKLSSTDEIRLTLKSDARFVGYASPSNTIAQKSRIHFSKVPTKTALSYFEVIVNFTKDKYEKRDELCHINTSSKMSRM